MKQEYMHQSIGSSLPAFTNGGSSLHPSMQTSIDMSAHARRIDVSPHMLLAQSSNMGMIPGMNGGIMKPETGFAGTSPFVYGANGDVLETHPAIGNPSVSSLIGIESNSQTPNETTLDVDTSSFGFLGQIPRNFSLSDLTANFSSSGWLSISLSLSLSFSFFLSLCLCV